MVDAHFTDSSKFYVTIYFVQSSICFSIGQNIMTTDHCWVRLFCCMIWLRLCSTFTDCKYIKSNEHYLPFFPSLSSASCNSLLKFAWHVLCLCVWPMFWVEAIFNWDFTHFTSSWFIQGDSEVPFGGIDVKNGTFFANPVVHMHDYYL